MQASITTLEAVQEFNFSCDETTTETLRNFYRGWLQSDLVDSLDGTERANCYYTFEKIIELIETLQKNAE